jgi:hypothetical protein
MPISRVREVELIASGTKLDSPTKGPYYRNMYLENNAWKVRPGFGQLAQYGTTQSRRDSVDNPQGLQKHLGSEAITTDFGHVQILSVFTSRAFTGNEGEQGIWGEFVSVQIQDVTTGRHWEEILFNHTAENNPTVRPMPYWQGTYETAREVDYQAWIRSSTDPLFFTEFSDHLLFGSKRLGLWAYVPADFDSNRHKQVDSASQHDWSDPYSESSLIVRIHPVPGDFDRSFEYLSSADWPNTPHDVAVVQGRLAIATGRDIFLSDPGKPASIITENQISIPSEQEITAIKEVGNSLLIWTSTETWHYTPNSGTVVSRGRLERVSPDVGCLSPSSVTAVGESVFWVDKNGAYSNNGGLSMNKLSEDLDPFFIDHITDPLSSFLVNQGITDLADEQPRLTYRLTPDLVSCTYDPVNQYVLTAIPEMNLILAYHPPKSSWVLWPLESTASGTVDAPTHTIVGSQRNLPNPWVLSADQRVFLISGPDTHTMQDAAIDGNTRARLEHDSVTRSYVITEWGRGGGIDRSVDIEEDNRIFTGMYVKSNQAADEGEYYIGKPVYLPDNYQFPGGIPGVATYGSGITKSNVWLFPLYFRPTGQTDYPIATSFVFKYDNVHWRAVTRTGAIPIIEIILPPEREGSAEGWGLGTLGPVAAVAECQVYDSAIPATDPNGDEIRMHWSAVVANARGWIAYANMNLCRNTKNLLCYIPFELVNPTLDTLSALGYSLVQAQVDGGVGLINSDVFVWQQAHIHDKHDEDDVAQPVDYAIKSDQVGLDSSNSVYYRGSAVRVKTHGTATLQIFPDHPWGLFNVAAGSDWNSWTSQYISHNGDTVNIPAITEIIEKSPIRSRIRNTVTDVDSERTFNNAATWSDTGVPATGNYLVDEVEVDSLQTSDSVKGQYVDVMVFGMIRSRAEVLVIDSVKAQLIPLPGNSTQRRGR